MTSLSTRFFGHPRLMNPAFGMKYGPGTGGQVHYSSMAPEMPLRVAVGERPTIKVTAAPTNFFQSARRGKLDRFHVDSNPIRGGGIESIGGVNHVKTCDLGRSRSETG